MASSASPSTATFGNSSSEGSNGLMALPAVMDMVADSQDKSGAPKLPLQQGDRLTNDYSAFMCEQRQHTVA